MNEMDGTLNVGGLINLSGELWGLCDFSSVQFSRSVMSDSLRPHESQHARLPCPSPTLEFTQTHIHGVSDAIQPYIVWEMINDRTYRDRN